MKLLTEIDKIKLINEFRISKEPAGSLQIQPSDTPDDLSSLDFRIGAKKVTEKVISSFSALSNNLTRSINRLINERKAKRRRIHHRDIQVTQHLLAPKKVSLFLNRGKVVWVWGEFRVKWSKISPTLFLLTD